MIGFLKQIVDNPTTFFAVLGTIGSLFAIGWHIYRDTQNRVKLKISVMVGKKIPQNQKVDYFVFSVTNIRQRCTILKLAGFEPKGNFKKDAFIFKWENLPKKLCYAEEYTYYMPLQELDLYLKEKKMGYRDIKCFTAWDTVGHEFRTSKKDLKRFLKQVDKKTS